MSNLIYGKGYYSEGKYKARDGNKKSKSYQIWLDMIRRCYSDKVHAKKPHYRDCYVADEWLDFQVFAEWYESHDHSDANYQLDKDILLPSNKMYSPETCALVPSEINNLIISRPNSRLGYPQGVAFDKRISKFYARLNINGRLTNLGGFTTANEAYQVYKKAKESYVKERALVYKDRITDNVFQALMNWELTA